MTLRELLDVAASQQPDENLDLEIKVWLPGSHISLSGKFFRGLNRDGTAILRIEGNLDAGSALS